MIESERRVLLVAQHIAYSFDSIKEAHILKRLCQPCSDLIRDKGKRRPSLSRAVLEARSKQQNLWHSLFNMSEIYYKAVIRLTNII